MTSSEERTTMNNISLPYFLPLRSQQQQQPPSQDVQLVEERRAKAAAKRRSTLSLQEGLNRAKQKVPDPDQHRPLEV